ncbi:MAG: enolase C-terminal domain-like protein, partial [Pseudonocardiaceae bacterium]
MDVAVYTVPTDQPEADGTLTWASTTMVVVEVRAGDMTGTGWTYAAPGVATVVREQLTDICLGANPLDAPGVNERMARACRNLGRTGLVACAISAVDTALWDLKARILDLSLAALFGQAVRVAPIYGSGGFTTYDESTTRAHLEQWVN